MNGTVNLILNNGVTLKANKGIQVFYGNTLNIYVQAGGTGKIIATGDYLNAGIGGGNGIGEGYKVNGENYFDGTNVNIYGGNVTASSIIYFRSDGSGDGIHLSWTKLTDSISIGKLGSSRNLYLDKNFVVSGDNTFVTGSYLYSNTKMKTIVPALTISFEADGGSGGMTTQAATYQSKYSLPECSFTAPEGKEFDCWLVDGLECPADAVVKAVWKQDKRTVTFDADGHGTAPDSQRVEYGGKLTEPDAPTESGYTFGGWYKEAERVNRWSFEGETVTENLTLYAKWAVNAYTITYDLDGGIDATNNPLNLHDRRQHDNACRTYEDGLHVHRLDSSGTIPSGSTGDKTFTATWQINQYTITFETFEGT